MAADSRSDESIVSHVLSMREKLAHMTDLVKQNLTQAQRQQKRLYDRTAVERRFQAGDQVLVLLPSETIANYSLDGKVPTKYSVMWEMWTRNFAVHAHF